MNTLSAVESESRLLAGGPLAKYVTAVMVGLPAALILKLSGAVWRKSARSAESRWLGLDAVTLLLPAALILLLSGSLYGSEIRTNLPVVIKTVLRTNVVSGNNQTGCSVCKFLQDASKPDSQGRVSVPAIFHPAHADGLPFGPATERWEITSVVEETTWVIYKNGFGGQGIGFPPFIKTLSSTTNRWTLKQEWKESK